MENPIDILGVHPDGALERPVDERDYTDDHPEIGMAAVPFDWSKGFDVEKDLNIVLPTKDQGPSSSCGGQTVSQQAEVLGLLLTGKDIEKSAKAYYSQVFAPGGGSNSRMLGNILVKQGLYSEDLVSSYENGKPPSEAFMENVKDISVPAKEEAQQTANMAAYYFPRLDIDSMAIALRDNRNLLIGIRGSNNGTWLSSFPSPVQEGALWAHFMFGAKAELVNGKKTIWAKQSWGPDVAPDTNSYQAITEDHFAYGRVWDAMAFISTVIPKRAHHTFGRDLHLNDSNDEVTELQATLINQGCFNLKPTGFYGPITAKAVLKFRLKHGIDTSTDPKGYSVGPKTRAVLNSL